MAWASRAGKAVTDPSASQAQGVCDRCGAWNQLSRLPFQYDWRGNRLMNIQLRVCTDGCLDVPFEFFRPIIVPPDPVPVSNPRPPQTNTGPNGWGVGGWGTGAWDIGQTWEQPVPPVEYAPPMTVSIDE